MNVHKVKYTFVSQLALLHRISLGMDNSLISIDGTVLLSQGRTETVMLPVSSQEFRRCSYPVIYVFL